MSPNWFPELDENGTPTYKLPICPQCEEDDLSVVHEDLVLCYNCGWKRSQVYVYSCPCPMCSRTVEVFPDPDNPIKFVFKCVCGHSVVITIQGTTKLKEK